MHPVIVKTFGGLSASYYFRQLVFGFAYATFVVLMASQSKQGLHIPMLLILVVNTLLYPYSRFVYESILDFVMGQNVFFVNVFLMLSVKLMTMLLCWTFAIVVAPIGLLYLYFYHSKESE